MIVRSRVLGRILSWLPQNRTSRQFLWVFLVDSVGTGMFLAGSALFFTRVIGLTSAQVGLGLSLSAAVGFLCAVPIGRLADRIGSRRTVVVLYVWRGIGFAAYALVHDFAGFVVVSCLVGATQWAIGPIVQAMVGAAEEGPSRVRTMATMNAIRNGGFVVGALLATVAIASGGSDGYRALVAGDAASFFVAALLLAPIALAERRPSGPPVREAPARMRMRDVRFLLLAGANGILFLHTVVLGVGLPLWISTRTHAPASLLGGVVVLNTLLAITLGVRLSRGVEGVAASAARAHWAGWSLAACCVLVALSAHTSGVVTSVLLLASVLALTLGELWQSIGAWGLSYALSPEDRRGYYLTVFYLGEPCATLAGPILLTSGVITGGSTGWLCLAGAFALTGVAVRVTAVRVGRPTKAAPDRLAHHRAPAEGHA